MGGTLTTSSALGRPECRLVGDISAYCWVLREHVSDLLEGRNDKTWAWSYRGARVPAGAT